MEPSAESCCLITDFVVVNSSVPEFQTVGIVDAYEYKCGDKKDETALIHKDLQQRNLDASVTNTSNIGKIARSSLKPVFHNFESEFINTNTENDPVSRLSSSGHTKVNKLKFAMDEGIKDNIINEELLCLKIDGVRVCPLKRKTVPSKVRFTVEEIAAKSKARLDALLDYQTRYTDTCTIREKSKVQTLTLVKEKPSSEYACTLELQQNKITLYPDNQIKVTKLENSENEVWEIEPGFQIFKSLDPMEFNLNRAKMGIVDNTLFKNVNEFRKLDLKAEGDKLIIGSELCSEYLAPPEVADLYVSNTIGHAKELYYTKVMNYGDPEMKRLAYLIPTLKVISNWSSIKHMSKEQGIYQIERYIVMTSELNEDWKYTIRFKGAQSDKVSDHYFYEVNFSLPSKLYPVAQVTAIIFFHMEVSRVIPPSCPVRTTFTIEGSRLKINPDKFTLRDNNLLRVLETKLQFIKKCSI